MKPVIIMTTLQSIEADNSTGYLIGAIIALLVFGYLVYALVKPEKF